MLKSYEVASYAILLIITKLLNSCECHIKGIDVYVN